MKYQLVVQVSDEHFNLKFLSFADLLQGLSR